MRKVFVSYAQEDKCDVDELVRDLNALGHHTWVDSSLKGGQTWWKEILEGITGCDVFLAVLSDHRLNSIACERELDWALLLNKPVLPVAVARLPPDALPRTLSMRQIVDYFQPGKQAAFALVGALASLPSAPPLPEQLPEPPPVPPTTGLLYDAFISYSRVDLEAAEQIERYLEAFPVPPEISARLGRPNLKVFREVSDLTGNRLGQALEDNLEQSRTLVVLCSPAARRSESVSIEVNRFAELREAERIFPVLVAGGPNNDPSVDTAEWAFPDVLSELLGGDPFATDFRQMLQSKSRRGKLDAGSPWVQLVANIVGVTAEDVADRIAKSERHLRLLLIGVLVVFLALVVALTVVIVLGVTAWNQRNEMRDLRDQGGSASVLRLTTESESVLAGLQGGGSDVRPTALTSIRTLCVSS